MLVPTPNFSHFCFWSVTLFSLLLELGASEWNQNYYRAKNVEQLQSSFKKNLRQVQADMKALEKRLYENIKIKPLSLGLRYRPREIPRTDFNQSRTYRPLFPATSPLAVPGPRTDYPTTRSSSAPPSSQSEKRSPALSSGTYGGKNQPIEKEAARSFSPLVPSPTPIPVTPPRDPSFLPLIILPRVEVPSVPPVHVPPAKPSGAYTVSYPVQSLRITYGGDPQGLPGLEPLSRANLLLEDGIEVSLGSLLSADYAGPLYEFTPQNLRELSQLMVHYLKEQGLEGMVALVEPGDIDPFTGKDLRRVGDHSLDFVVWVSRVDDVRLDYDSNLQHTRNLWKLKKQISRQMNREGVLGQPLRTSFKQSIKRLNRHPSKSARLLLLPATRPGEVDAVVEVREQKNLAFSLGASNSGSPTTGEWLINGTVQAYELTRNDDPADFSWVISDSGERYGFSGGYLIPLVQPGVLDLSLRSTYSEYDGTSFAVTAFEFEGYSWMTDLALRGSPLSWESSSHSFSYELGLGYERANAYNSIIQENAQIDFLVPRLGIYHKHEGGVVRSLSILLLRSNLNAIPVPQRELFGGLDVEDRVPSIHFSHASLVNLGKLGGDGAPSFESGNRHSLLIQFRASASLSGERMLPSMQSILGGASGVRGYPEACVAGDQAFLFSLEYQWKFFSSGAWGLTLAPFLDYGKTYIHDLMPHEAENTLASWGIGLGIGLPGGGTARLDLAKPLEEVVNGSGDIREGTTRDDYRVHASTQWKF